MSSVLQNMAPELVAVLVKFRNMFAQIPIEVRNRVIELLRAGEYGKANLVLDGWGK